MIGNGSEWCNDVYASDYYKNSPKKDPYYAGTDLGNNHVRRGGGNKTSPWRAADRSWGDYNYSGSVYCFRVVRMKRKPSVGGGVGGGGGNSW